MKEMTHQIQERRWAFVRMALGLLQMAGAAFSLTLLFLTGVNTVSLGAVAVTGILTTISILLFGGRPPDGLPRIEAGEKKNE